MGIFTISQPGLPAWVEHHDHSWCPYCYLGWPRDERGLAAGQCCSVWTPDGLVDLHVPAITFDRENLEARIMLCLRPRPWEIPPLQKAGIDPRRIFRKLPGLAEAFQRERARCEHCAAWAARRRVPCRRHGKQIDADANND